MLTCSVLILKKGCNINAACARALTRALLQKLSYIHHNPVEYGLCSQPRDYKFSSAVNYSGEVGLLNVELLSRGLNTIG